MTVKANRVTWLRTSQGPDGAWRARCRYVAARSGRVVSVWFGLTNMNGIQPDSLERWSVQVERNMSKGILVPRNT